MSSPLFHASHQGTLSWKLRWQLTSLVRLLEPGPANASDVLLGLHLRTAECWQGCSKTAVHMLIHHPFLSITREGIEVRIHPFGFYTPFSVTWGVPLTVLANDRLHWFSCWGKSAHASMCSFAASGFNCALYVKYVGCLPDLNANNMLSFSLVLGRFLE